MQWGNFRYVLARMDSTPFKDAQKKREKFLQDIAAYNKAVGTRIQALFSELAPDLPDLERHGFQVTSQHKAETEKRCPALSFSKGSFIATITRRFTKFQFRTRCTAI